MSSQHSIQGRGVVLIAGGAKNLGGLIARDLAAHGAKAVAIHYNSAASRADAEGTAAAVEKAGAKAVTLQGDLTWKAPARRWSGCSCRRRRRSRPAGHQHRRQGAEEAVRRHHRGRVRRDGGGQRQIGFFFPCGRRQARQRPRQGGDAGHLRLLGAFHALLRLLCGHQGAGGALHGGSAARRWTRHRRWSPPSAPARWTRPSTARKVPTPWPTTARAAALSPFSPTGLTHIEDVVPFIRHLVSDGWWITGQTILINGGYTTK